MSQRVLLHIGFPKTGSTAIQAALCAREEQRAATNYRFPAIAGRWNHAYVAASYLPPKQWPRRLRSAHAGDQSGTAELADFVRRDFREWLAEGSNLVISSEAFRRFGPSEVAAVEADIRSVGTTETMIVAYVRDPAKLYQSWIQQDLKAAGSIPSPDYFHCQYRQMLQVWKRFSPDRLVVRLFDRDRLAGGDVVQDFLSVADPFMGEYMSDTEGATAITDSANQSVSAEAAIVLERYRQRYFSGCEHVTSKSGDRLVRWLRRSEAWLPQNPINLHPEAEDRVLAANASDVEYLSREHGIEILNAASHLRHSKGDAGDSARRCSIKDVLRDWDDEIVEKLWQSAREDKPRWFRTA